ncbi:unnamed protein product [Acanthoscelides obtectus]|uniref:THAP-type domain-containing protein n=1 Tax=Acanthoscelides obtectus TaxID=200917 RepID=A0A9P0JQY1_ACAOB|nr:unnamed protein product [Acanthoscelides obtectus]CAK1671232.1 hypothetical protein AOBTE_LOCUS28168 [Acanthoscelides obtectus]
MEAYRKRGFKKCVVPGCTDRNSKRHTFPKHDAPLFNKWIEQVRNPVLDNKSLEQIYKRHLVCDLHFSESDKVPGTKRGLKRTAFPTLHLPELQFSSDGLIKPLRVNITPGMKTYTPKKSCHINIHETEIKQENDDFETTIHQSSLEKSEEPDADVVEIKTEHSFDISSAEEPDSHSKMGSTATYSTFQSVKNEHWDGVKQENQLLAEVKSEKQETSPTVDNTKFENMDTMVLKKEFEIKSEYDEDAISDLA